MEINIFRGLCTHTHTHTHTSNLEMMHCLFNWWAMLRRFGHQLNRLYMNYKHSVSSSICLLFFSIINNHKWFSSKHKVESEKTIINFSIVKGIQCFTIHSFGFSLSFMLILFHVLLMFRLFHVIYPYINRFCQLKSQYQIDIDFKLSSK